MSSTPDTVVRRAGFPGRHAPNEMAGLGLPMKGVETAAYLWGALARNVRKGAATTEAASAGGEEAPR